MLPLYFWMLIITTVAIYSIAFCLLYANRFTPFVTIRSVKLLQMGNLGIFLSIITHLVKGIIFGKASDKPHCDYLLIVFHYLIIISIVFRFVRLILCTKINFLDDDLNTLLRIESKIYHYEFIYMRYLLIFTFSLFGILLILYFCQIGYETLNESRTYLWAIIHFIDMLALLTIGPLLSVRSLEYHIKIEYFITCSIFFVYFLIIDFIKIKIRWKDFYPTLGSYFHSFFLVSLMIFKSVFPFISKCLGNKQLFYKFTPELTKDLYLFLSNEEFYDLFHQYLSDNRLDNKGVNLLELYIRLIRLKMKFNQGIQEPALQTEVDRIYNDYFSIGSKSKGDLFSDQDKTEIQVKYNEIKNGDYSFEIFNCGLTSCFKYLLEKFKEFQQTQDFISLQTQIKYDCYIQLKLCSSGLILLNKDN